MCDQTTRYDPGLALWEKKKRGGSANTVTCDHCGETFSLIISETMHDELRGAPVLTDEHGEPIGWLCMDCRLKLFGGENR